MKGIIFPDEVKVAARSLLDRAKGCTHPRMIFRYARAACAVSLWAGGCPCDHALRMTSWELERWRYDWVASHPVKADHWPVKAIEFWQTVRRMYPGRSALCTQTGRPVHRNNLISSVTRMLELRGFKRMLPGQVKRGLWLSRYHGIHHQPYRYVDPDDATSSRCSNGEPVKQAPGPRKVIGQASRTPQPTRPRRVRLPLATPGEREAEVVEGGDAC